VSARRAYPAGYARPARACRVRCAVRALLVPPALAGGVLAGVLACASGGPDATPPVPPPRAGTPPAPSGPVPRPAATATPASPPVAFPTGYALPCGRYLDAAAVLAVLRTGRIVPSAATVAVTTGPYCSGQWQFTAFAVAGLGPLQVVTRGTPGALTLVTAGTDVCTPGVRAQAPAGILTVARC